MVQAFEFQKFYDTTATFDALSEEVCALATEDTVFEPYLNKTYQIFGGGMMQIRCNVPEGVRVGSIAYMDGLLGASKA